MAVNITGDMSQDDIDNAYIEDLRSRVNRHQGEIKLDPAQAERLLQLLDDYAAEPSSPGHGQGGGQGQGKP